MRSGWRYGDGDPCWRAPEEEQGAAVEGGKSMQHRLRGHRRSLAIALALPLLTGWSHLSFSPERALAQSPGIHIAGATNVSPLVLTRGCNQIVAESANGTPVAGITALVSPMKAVVSIWRFNNGS